MPLIEGASFFGPWGSSKNPFAFAGIYPKKGRVSLVNFCRIEKPDLWNL
jgi:hypothetical protein